MKRMSMLVVFAAALVVGAGTSTAYPDEGTEREQEQEHAAEPGDDSGGGEDGVRGRGRAAHDVRVRLSLARRRSPSPLVKIRVKNRGTEPQSGVQVRLYADSETGVELWSGSADLAPRRSASFRFLVMPPEGTMVLVATAALDGVADERPDDNASRASLRRGGRAGNAAIGAALYAANCASCHGTDARGTTQAPDIRREGAGEILEALREGEDGMPAFPNLSARDAACLAAFLRDPEAATPPAPPAPPPAPPPGTAPTYAGQVKAILDANCASCHGATSPMAGVRLDTLAGASANAARALAAVQAGRMPPGGPLSPADVLLLQDWVLGGKNP